MDVKRTRKSHRWDNLPLYISLMLLLCSVLFNALAVKSLRQTLKMAREATETAKESQEIAHRALEQLENDKAIDEAVYIEEVQPILKAFVQEKQEGITMTVTATAYCPCIKCCGIWSQEHPSRVNTGYIQKTASGTIPVPNRTIAVDPKYIPLGSRVIINGKEYIAEDTGSGVDGPWVDIFCATHQEALDWGMQTMEVTVYED